MAREATVMIGLTLPEMIAGALEPGDSDGAVETNA
jgi:hypothetical protein